jgi:hypothetical protein
MHCAAGRISRGPSSGTRLAFEVYRPPRFTLSKIPPAGAVEIGEMSFGDLRDVTFGGQDYGGDFHFTMFSRDHIKGLLTELGFGDLAFTVLGRKNGQCRELEIVGVRHE